MLGNDNMCFACGEDNPISLGLNFKKNDDKTVRAEFQPKMEHQGYKGIMHGGLISTLMDEAMAKVLSLNDILALTAKMNIRFRQPVSIDKKLVITAEIVKNKTGLYFTEAEVRGINGELFAEAEAKFMKVEEE